MKKNKSQWAHYNYTTTRSGFFSTQWHIDLDTVFPIRQRFVSVLFVINWYLYEGMMHYVKVSQQHSNTYKPKLPCNMWRCQQGSDQLRPHMYSVSLKMEHIRCITVYKYLGHREGLEGKDLRDMIQTVEEHQHKSNNKIFYIFPHSSTYFFSSSSTHMQWLQLVFWNFEVAVNQPKHYIRTWRHTGKIIAAYPSEYENKHAVLHMCTEHKICVQKL